MGYKQTDNPFTKLNNSFTNPRVARREVRESEALKWNMPDFNSIVETKADGSTVTEDKKTENTTGTNKEGAVPEAKEGQDGINASVVKKIDQQDAREKQSEEARSWKDEKKGRKKHEKQNKRDVKHYTKGINRGEVDKDDEGYQEAIARQGYYDTHDTKGKDWHEVEDDFQAGNKKRLKDEADAKWIEESISDMENQDWYKEDQKAEDERVQAEMTERLNRFKKEDDLAEANKKQANAYGRGKGQAPGMYNNTINMKQVNSKGDAFPMVAQQPQTNPYGQEEQSPNRAGRSPQSNQLINDPNINQPLNKVPNSSFETNEKFSQIASDPGQLYDEPQPVENIAGNNPAYGTSWKRKKSSATTKRGDEISIITNKRRDGEAEDAALDHSTIGRTNIFNRPTPDTPNTVTYSKTNKKGKTKSTTAKGGTKKSDRLHKKYARKASKGTKGETEYDQFDEGLGMYGGEDPVKKMHNDNPYKLNPSIPTKPTKQPKKSKKKKAKAEATPSVVQGFIDAQGQAMYNGPSNEKGKVELDGKEVSYNKGGMRENLTKQGKIKPDGKITKQIWQNAEDGDYGSLAQKQATFSKNAFGFTGTAMEKHTKVTESNYKSAEKDDAAHASYLKRDVKDIQKSHMSQAKKDAWETADEKHISKLYGDLKYDHGHHGRKYDNV